MGKALARRILSETRPHDEPADVQRQPKNHPHVQAVATGGHLFCASPAQPTGFERWAIEPSFNRRPDVIYTRDLDLGKGDTAWIAF